MCFNKNWFVIAVCAGIYILCSSIAVASVAESHSKWLEVLSVEWGSHKPNGGDAAQVKLMKTYVLVKMSDGSVKKIWNARLTLGDGRIVSIDKGRLVDAKATKNNKTEIKSETKAKVKAEAKHSSDSGTPEKLAKPSPSQSADIKPLPEEKIKVDKSGDHK